MAIIQFANGTRVNFNGQPSQSDIEEVASQMGFNQSQPEVNPYGATFRATGNETGLQAGLKSAGNLPSSAINFGKGIVDMVSSPIQTGKGLLDAVIGGGAKLRDLAATGIDKATGSKYGSVALGKGATDTKTIDAIGGVIKDRYGSLENAQKTAIEDPFGVGSDIVGLLSGGAALAGKSAQAGVLASKVARVATAPVRVPVKAAAGVVKKTTGFGVSQATGLSPETLKTVLTDTKAFKDAKAAGTTRVDLANDVFGAISKASDELSDLGKGYDAIRSSGKTVTLPTKWIEEALKDFKLQFKNGAVVADRTSKTRNVTDINKIQSFADNWGSSKTFTTEEYLNMRHDLAELAKYDMAGSNVAREFATRLREGTLNSDKVRTQISGLKELDNTYASDVKFYKQMKKDFLDNDGKLKDGAASKVVNSITAANPERLARLERLYPGFTQQAKVVKALEDVENAMGLKVGTYARAGAGVAGVATGNLALILSAILATPEIALPLLMGLGLSVEKIAPILKAIREFASDINNFRVPGAVEAFIEKNTKDAGIGMSIKSNVRPDLAVKKLTLKEIDTIKRYNTNPTEGSIQGDIQAIKEKIGIDKADTAIQDSFLKEVSNEYDRTFDAKDTSTSKKPIGKEGVSKQPVDTSGGFDGRGQIAKKTEDYARVEGASLDPATIKLSGDASEKTASSRASSMFDPENNSPVTLKVNKDGSLQVVDGNARVTAFKNQGKKIEKYVIDLKKSDADALKAFDTPNPLYTEARGKSLEEFVKAQGKPFEKEMYRGTGGGGGLQARGDIGNALGEGKYYAGLSQAVRYGKNIETKVVKLKNPITIKTDQDLRNITGGKNLVVSEKSGVTPQMVKKQIEEARNKIIEMGHDGVIIEMGAYQDTQNLRRLFEHDQVIVYK